MMKLQEIEILDKINRIRDQSDREGFVWVDSVIDREEPGLNETLLYLRKNGLVTFLRQSNFKLPRKVKLTEKGKGELRKIGVLDL